MSGPTAGREARAGWAFVSPGLVVIGLFFVLPALAALLLSVTDFDLYSLGAAGNTRFVGLANYVALFRDPVFWTALGNTFYFVLVGGPLTIAAALGAALLLDARLARFRGLFRTVYFAPVVTTLVAVATVWRYLYHPRAGVLNMVLGWIGLAPVDWMGDPRWAMTSIVLIAVWKNFGYTMVIFIAGLQNIPETLYEAARIDGAGPFRQFRHITLPLLGPTFVFAVLITIIGYFQLFAEPYVMTGGTGGPVNSTLSIALLMYKQGFRWWSMGYAAALAVVLFAIILAASLLQRRLQRRLGR